MNEKIFDFIIKKYENQIQNDNVWKEFKIQLNDEVSLSKINDMEKFIKNLGVKVEKGLLEQKGYTEIHGETIKIFIDFTNPERVNRFTLAHELAHIIFDYDRLKSGERINSNYMENELFHDPSEVRANQFAAELLMPTNFIIQLVNKMFENKRAKEGELDVTLTTEEVIPQIIAECNVSYSAVENRLKNLGMVK